MKKSLAAIAFTLLSVLLFYLEAARACKKIQNICAR